MLIYENIYVKQGAFAKFIKQPAQKYSSKRKEFLIKHKDCRSGITCCMGRLHICCDDFKVIGRCDGSWNCSTIL